MAFQEQAAAFSRPQIQRHVLVGNQLNLTVAGFQMGYPVPTYPLIAAKTHATT